MGLMRPMLATAAVAVPVGPEWVHEVKWDGMRVLADVRAGELRLTSRTERDVTVAFPELSGLAGCHEDMLLDGEVVSMRSGSPDFSLLAERFHISSERAAAAAAARAPATYLVFDLLRLFGVDLTARSLADRRATLERLDVAGEHWRVPPTFTDGAALLTATAEQGLEGVVSKRLDSRYHPGARSNAWLKSPHRLSVSLVIGGWRPEVGTTDRLGALLVGVPAPGGLRYLGRVGSGIAGRAARALASDLAPLRSDDCPFADPAPAADAAGATWVHPVLVCEVRTLGLTSQGRLRQPSFHGLRPDLTAGDVDPADLTSPSADRHRRG